MVDSCFGLSAFANTTELLGRGTIFVVLLPMGYTQRTKYILHTCL